MAAVPILARSPNLRALLIALGLTTVLLSIPARSSAAESSSRPNIVVILADDLGWGDLACFGHPLIKTPNLDKLAAQGLRLTQCYSGGAVCSPSRSALLTGRTPYRNGVFTWIPEGRDLHLRTSEITIATLLKQQGYDTCHAGKWHLNSHFNQPTQPQPNDHGYGWWLATQNNAAPSHEFPDNFVRNGQPVDKIDTYSALYAADETIRWLKQKRDPQKPFLISLWTHEPHYPIKSAPEFKAQYPDLTDDVQREHHANVTQLDAGVGRLLKALDELKLTDNTLVIFTSDNGPEGDGVKTPGRGSTGGLRGRKRSIYEGGIRVPGIVRWPGKVQPGTTSHAPVIGSDIFATLCAVTDTKSPADRVIDGGSFLPVLEGKRVTRSRPLYWRCPIAPEKFKTAMRIDDWKIVADEGLTQFELYHLGNDPHETHDLAERETAKLAEMQQALAKLNAEIEAEGPDWWKTYNHGGRAKPAPTKAK